MAATDADIANIALLRIGEREFVTSPLAADTSSNGQVLAVAYPLARDTLLSSARWRFARKSAWLYQDGKIVPNPETPVYSQPGWLYAFVLPADYLEAGYIFSGARPAQSVAPTLYPSPWTTSRMPYLSGVAPQAPFEIGQGLLFTDFSDDTDPPAFDVGTTYAQGEVISYLGAAYVSLQAANLGQAPDTPGSVWWAKTEAVELAYTSKVTDVTKMPPLFVDALAWQLAVDLALSVAGKPELAVELQKKAELALHKAVAAEANAHRRDLRPATPGIASRR